MARDIGATHALASNNRNLAARLRVYRRTGLTRELWSIAIAAIACPLAAAFPADAWLIVLSGVSANLFFHRSAERQSASLTRLNAELEARIQEVQTLSLHLEQANGSLFHGLGCIRAYRKPSKCAAGSHSGIVRCGHRR